MNTPLTPLEGESPLPLLGQCVQAGDDAAGQPRLIIHTTEDALSKQARNLIFQDVAIVRADEFESAEVVAYDGAEMTVTLRFGFMPCAAIGERWLVRASAGNARWN